MRVLVALNLCLVLVLLSTSAAFAQFMEKNRAFQQPGVGEEDREYMVLVPEEVTIITRDGDTIRGGETVGIPGKSITLLNTGEADQTIEAGELFNEYKEKDMPAEQKQEYAVVEVKIPEGMTISHEDGRTIEGETTINLMVTSNDMQASSPMDESPIEIRAIRESGFQHR